MPHVTDWRTRLSVLHRQTVTEEILASVRAQGHDLQPQSEAVLAAWAVGELSTEDLVTTMWVVIGMLSTRLDALEQRIDDRP